jgi:hypothetical protein
MLQSFITSVNNGIIEFETDLKVPNGTLVLVTILDDTDLDRDFWLRVSEQSLAKIWDNNEDDIYQKKK